MNNIHRFGQNHLLATLPEEDLTRLASQLELIQLQTGQLLCDPSTPSKHVYFPTTSIISLLYQLDDGSLAETAAVGNEGIVGIELFMGGETTLNRAIVQSPGHAYRLEGLLLKKEFHLAGAFQRIMMLYTQALLSETAQTLVCIRHHSLDQQFCRWLLQRFDRLSVKYLVMSQEAIANVLGVRRASISELAISLRNEGLIEYDRGRISLLDRAGMEARTCECYAAIGGEFDRLLQKACDRTVKLKQCRSELSVFA
jgi:CRP-like cAMP-binding protein